MKIRSMLFNAVCLLFIVMFMYAAVSKWLGYNIFVFQMSKQPFPHFFLPFLVWGIPISEVVVSFLLMLDKTRALGLKIATGMMVVFTGYIIFIQLHLFKGKMPCSCGGAIVDFSWGQHLIFNLFFVVAGALAILLIRKNQQQQLSH